MLLFSLLMISSFGLIKAKPELYRENEDFQFSRSSSVDGTKSGFYGAQRGNMGGNFEKAHNMDNVAQHQMSNVIGQLEGELGDVSKSRIGSIRSAANTQGVYGSGKFDLSNLQGRNFQEGVKYDNSLSHSSLTSHNSGYNTHSASHLNSGYNNKYAQGSRQGGYEAAGFASQLQSGDLQAANNLNVGTEFEYDSKASHQSKYISQSEHRDRTNFDYLNRNSQSSNYHGFNADNNLANTSPVKIILRPGAKIVVPVSYENGQGLSRLEHNSANSDVEFVSNNHRTVNIVPTSNSKHYESAYSYKKEWEKHEDVPLAVVTNSYIGVPKNSELYEDSVISGKTFSNQYQKNLMNLHNSQIDHAHETANIKTASRYNANQISHNSQLNKNHQAAYEMNRQDDSKSYIAGTSDAGSELPKNYQSSYSYHKSWERQGDPYVIKPAQSSVLQEVVPEKLINTAYNQGFSSSQHKHSHQDYSQTVDCDDTHIH